MSARRIVVVVAVACLLVAGIAVGQSKSGVRPKAAGDIPNGVGVSLNVVPVQGKRVFVPVTLAGFPGAPGYFWEYSAKFLCGTIPPENLFNPQFAKPLVPGTYMTIINLRNYNFKAFQIRKFAVLFNPEGQQHGTVGPPQNDGLGINEGIQLNCDTVANDLLKLGAAFDPHLQFIEGDVVILSPLDLDVSAAYTLKNVEPQPQ